MRCKNFFVVFMMVFIGCAYSVHALENLPLISENPKKEELFIFVSFSMSDQSLREWAIQAQRAGGILVLRGLIQNSIRKTVERIQAVFGRDHIPVLNIDPVAFKTFGIKVVPAVVIADQANVPNFDLIYGDVGLRYALRQIIDRGEQAALAKIYWERLGKPL